MSTPRLLWVQQPLLACPGTGEPVQYREAILHLHFPDGSSSAELEMGYCASNNTWLAEWPFVEESLEESGLSLRDVEGFGLDEHPEVPTDVWMGPALGSVRWEEFKLSQAELEKTNFDQPTPDLLQMLALPQNQESWAIAHGPTGYVLGEKDKPTVSHTGVIVDPRGLVRSFIMDTAPLGPDKLRELVFRSSAFAHYQLPAIRPATVLVEDPFMVNVLGKELGEVGIGVELGDVGLAQEALSSLKHMLDPEPVAAYFSQYSEGEVKTFFGAAKDFFQARPWEVFKGDTFIAFRFGPEPWHYANVMGQMGESFGLAMFGDWLEICRLINNPDSPLDMIFNPEHHMPRSIMANGGSEALSLSQPHEMAPDDAAYLKRLKIKPTWRKEYATVHRFTPTGTQPPRFDIASYTHLMQVITERVMKVRGNQINSIKAALETGKGKLEVRYPAKGEEDMQQQNYYRFKLPFEYDRPRKVMWMQVEAPGEAKWHRIMTEVTRLAKTQPQLFPWIPVLKQGQYNLWLDQAPAKEPSPTLDQIAHLSDLSVERNLETQESLHLTPIPRPEKAGIVVRWEE